MDTTQRTLAECHATAERLAAILAAHGAPAPPLTPAELTLAAALLDPPIDWECPRCGAISHHPADREHGYCARCHDWTAPPRPGAAPWR